MSANGAVKRAEVDLLPRIKKKKPSFLLGTPSEDGVDIPEVI